MIIGRKSYCVRDCHIFAHWGRSLCSKKCAQLVFSCFWLQNWCVLKIWKKLSILWYTKFQLITVKYHGVKALFCKLSRHVEKLGSLHTKCQYQVTVLGTAPVLEIGTILLHLNGRNFLIPYPRSRQDHISNHRGRHLLPKNWRPNLKIHPTKISKVGTFSLKQVLSSMPTFILWYLVAFELFMSQEWHSAYFCTGSWKFILSATCCIAQHRLKTWQIYRWIFAHNFTYTCPNDLNDHHIKTYILHLSIK